MAKRALGLAGLQMVVWLVSPQNPLKSSQDMASPAARFAACKKIAAPYRWLYVSDFESHIQAEPGHRRSYVTTAETLLRLRRALPLAQLIWIMGADNLAQFDSWEDSEVIRRSADLLIMGRPGYSYRALASRSRHQLGPRSKPRQLGLGQLSGKGKKGWAFDNAAYNLLSATELRRAGKGL